MFTRNFQILLAGLFNPNTTGYYVAPTNTQGKIMGGYASVWPIPIGSVPTMSASSLISSEVESVTNSNKDGVHILVGTGTTPPTKEDYKLEAQSTALIPQSKQAYSATTKAGSTTAIITETFANFSDATVTVSEVGLYYVGYGSSPVTWQTGICLIAREVLAEPIVMNPGALHTCQMTLDFSNI